MAHAFPLVNFDTSKLRLLIWMNMPSHHQSAFFNALKKVGIDLVVHYYGGMNKGRLEQGWGRPDNLPPGERFVRGEVGSLKECPDWRARIHVVPGYGSTFLRILVRTLSSEGIPWMHWSEPAYEGLRWWISYPLKRWYARIVNNHAVRALAIGTMARDDFRRWGINEDKISIFPYAVEGLSPSVPPDPEVHEFTARFSTAFMYVGLLCHRKATDILIEAFSRVVTAQPGSGLVLVGKDSGEGNYRKLAEKFDLSERILFRGPIPANSVASVLRCCQVFILPSRFDGWGMGLNEAASLGKALISTEKCGSAHHLIVHGENGFRVLPDNSEALSEAMIRYATDPELVERHGKRSATLFAEYTPEKNALNFLKILEEWMSPYLKTNRGT